VTFTPSSIAALIVAASFAAGLNVYATVATLGILARFDWVTLPPGLHALSNPWIIAVSSLLFAVEVFADKIPAFDLVWNAAHTFIRVPVAALLAYQAASQLSPEMKLLAAIAGAAIAAIAHTSKTAARALVTPSPEPLSNIALSASEDVAAISLTWLATHHPFAAAGIATAAIVFLLLRMRWIATRLKRLTQRLFRPQPAP
jgi:ABC-type Co2+ transport system permease subunit